MSTIPCGLFLSVFVSSWCCVRHNDGSICRITSPFFVGAFVDNPHQGNLILYTTDVKLAEVKSLGLGYLQASGCFTFIFGYDLFSFLKT